MKKGWISQALTGLALGALIFAATFGLRIWYGHLTAQSLSSATDQEKAKLKTGSREKMVLIPAGMFTFGTDPAREKPVPEASGLLYTPYKDETPLKTFFLPDYYIDRYEVTVGEYRKFCEQTNRKLPKLWTPEILEKGLQLPAFGVTGEQASAYAKWAGKRLPTEGEWEKAARGPKGNRYVWGNEFDSGFLPSFKTLTVIGSNPVDISHYGVMDMAGNISEWTSDIYAPYRKGNPLERLKNKKSYVWRGYHFTEGLGGHYGSLPYFFRTAYRGVGEIGTYYPIVGFRCAQDAS